MNKTLYRRMNLNELYFSRVQYKSFPGERLSNTRIHIKQFRFRGADEMKKKHVCVVLLT